MSGIAGILHRARRPNLRSELSSMLQQMSHRGPDGNTIGSRDRIALGHCLLSTTPESSADGSTLDDLPSSLLLTADTRIDNRDELLPLLHLPRSTPDPQVILAAYQRWGENCPAHLLGDFAFALWDPYQQHLFCARDPMGVKPFYYFHSLQLFACASEIHPLFSLPEIPRRLNEARLAGYLFQRGGSIRSILNDHQETLYQDIFPLRAGHWLKVTPAWIQTQAYWQLDPDQELHLSSDQEYAEAFRDLFNQAVTCRLRSSTPIGIQLSGGLDSSTVACTARRISIPPLHAYTALFPSLSAPDRRRVDEQSYLMAILHQGGLIPHTFAADRLSPLRDQGDLYWHPDEAYFAPSMYLNRETYQLAAQQGIRVLLDGVDGDTVVSHGLIHLQELARSSRWWELAQQIQALKTFGQSPWQTWCQLFWLYQLRPHLLRGPLRRRWQTHQEQGSSTPKPLLRPEVLQRLDLEQRSASEAPDRKTDSALRQDHYRSLTAGIIQASLHMFDKTAAQAGVEIRHPFFDRRIIEFCLSLPASQRLDRGWTRLVMRRAMEGILPPTVQWRPTKADLGPGLLKAFLHQERSWLEAFTHSPSLRLLDYIDPEILRQAMATCQQANRRETYHDTRTHRDGYLLWVAAELEIWLQYTGL